MGAGQAAATGRDGLKRRRDASQDYEGLPFYLHAQFLLPPK